MAPPPVPIYQTSNTPQLTMSSHARACRAAATQDPLKQRMMMRPPQQAAQQAHITPPTRTSGERPYRPAPLPMYPTLESEWQRACRTYSTSYSHYQVHDIGIPSAYPPNSRVMTAASGGFNRRQPRSEDNVLFHRDRRARSNVMMPRQSADGMIPSDFIPRRKPSPTRSYTW